ncbi:glycerol-3-phosphate responsive antiterminator GlpP, partial [Listeria booriae]
MDLPFSGQSIIPAAHNQKDMEKILELDVTYMVMLETHVAQLKSLIKYAQSGGKKVLLHADLV